MLAELIRQWWVDATEVVIKATHILIDKAGRKRLDAYRIQWDALINKFERENRNYRELVYDYILLDLN